MKNKLTIGEFAKLRNITTETLRHYDRMGLLKPTEIDSNTGYRYYSILQYEVLGTILELRQLGMSIDEIKKYLNNRNLKQSVNILKDEHNKLLNRLNELKNLEESINEKIKYLEDISKVTNLDSIIIKDINERGILTFDRIIKNEIDLSYACLELENSLMEIAPILASNRYGAIIKQENIELEKYTESIVIFLFVKDKKSITENNIKIIPKGTYACMYYKGVIWKLEKHIKKLKKYIKKKGYAICGDVIQIVQIDISVTDEREEELFELQVPIKKG